MSAVDAALRFVPVGDRGLLVEFGSVSTPEVAAAVAALDAALAAAPPAGFREAVPAMVNLLIDFDPLTTDHAAIESAARELVAAPRPDPADPTERVVQVCYHDTLAPDLAAVAAASTMSPAAVVDAHLAGDYRVAMYGFAPGYAYLTGVDDRIQVPRKPAAVRDVAAGSVIIAGPQCLVTTLTMPTGWSILGRAATPILQPDANRPFHFDVGDRVRFERIDLAEYERLAAQP